MADSTRPAGFASLYVERCRIDNFRGITECSMELEPGLTVLVGRNNAGKSRVLRAIAIALGAAVDLDDLTVGQSNEAVIDVIIAPPPPTSATPEEVFDRSIARRLDQPQVLQEEPPVERFAWRTTIRRSAAGMGARSDSQLLVFDAEHREWVLPNIPTGLSREQRSLVAAELVDTRRDLVEELSRRGSAIRRVLSDLEVPDDIRKELETELSALGNKIIDASGALGAVRSSLTTLGSRIESIGSPALSPLPVRLEELARSVAIDLDTGSGALPARLHGAGARSLASLQVQGVNYERRLGRDGPTTRPHPVTLVEEPEAHLHPQAELELVHLLKELPGQVVASTHSSHLVTSVDPRCIRLVRSDGTRMTVIDLGPAASEGEARHRALRPSSHVEEMEKLKRLVERPFGELLFASAVVIGDGATERAFLPPLLRHAIGHRAHGVCVIDPGSLSSPAAHAAVKFAKLAEIPWLIFGDSDGPGMADAQAILDAHAAGDSSHIVWIQGEDADANKSCGATEHMMICFDDLLTKKACVTVRPNLDEGADALTMLKQVKGSVGATLAALLIDTYPSHADWPSSLKSLVRAVERKLPRSPS